VFGVAVEVVKKDRRGFEMREIMCLGLSEFLKKNTIEVSVSYLCFVARGEMEFGFKRR